MSTDNKLTLVVSGATFQHRKALKSRRFKFIGKKKGWVRSGLDPILANFLRDRFSVPGLKVVFDSPKGEKE